MVNPTNLQTVDTYVGTLVGESTSSEFRLAVAHESIREQDIIAVDAELSPPGDNGSTESAVESFRIWAKVQRIERINPLFPREAGHELAATRTDPLDTVLSLSREMVTAVCKVLGVEPQEGGAGGKLEQLRYPAKPATTAYRPDSEDIKRIVLGDLDQKSVRSIDLATLSNRPEVDVHVDGHSIVTRHLAILAMTGAGKSWTARRIIEQLAEKNYPIVIFDPHGDYTGLSDVPSLSSKVNRYYAQFPVLEEETETVAQIIGTLSGDSLTPAMSALFGDVFSAARSFLVNDPDEMRERIDWLATRLGNPNISRYGMNPNMWLVAHVAKAGELAVSDNDTQDLTNWGWDAIGNYNRTNGRTLSGISWRAYRAASVLQRMEAINRNVARDAVPLPTDRTTLVNYGNVSVISLAGYTADFQATMYSIIADDIFEKRVSGELKLPVLFLLEEAHYFAPARAITNAEQRAISMTRQIAQEGRKFGVGLTIISQRPSRLDETTLSQCNSQIIMRMVNPADQRHVRNVIESLGEDDARMLPDLDVGEAILSGQFINFPVLVRIKPPESQGEREEQDAFQALEEARAEMQRENRSRSNQLRMVQP